MIHAHFMAPMAREWARRALRGRELTFSHAPWVSHALAFGVIRRRGKLVREQNCFSSSLLLRCLQCLESCSDGAYLTLTLTERPPECTKQTRVLPRAYAYRVTNFAE